MNINNYEAKYDINYSQHALGKDPEINPFRSIKRPFQRLK